jgi:hypothetical protein
LVSPSEQPSLSPSCGPDVPHSGQLRC